MNSLLIALLAVLSIWDYPDRRLEHDHLRAQFIVAMRTGKTEKMAEICRKGVKLLPDDPTWHYNLACSLAYFPKLSDEAFDQLEQAIDLGFRDVKMIENDSDLKRLAELPRYRETIDYAKFKSTQPVMIGPMATVAATGVFGKSISLGEQNLSWDFDVGCFDASMKLAPASGAYSGLLYFNRDGAHSYLRVPDFPGLTAVSFDKEGRSRGMDMDFPNSLFPYPTFGNCSRAMTSGPYWRSLSRAMLTMHSDRLNMMTKFYLSNQFWVFPSNADTAPVGTNGDVFASIAPYWLTTAGRSYSDLPYLRAALEATASFKPAVRERIVSRGLLTPTLMALLRKSLAGVTNDTDYLTAKAHPTAMPPGKLEVARLKAQAAAMKESEIPPLAIISVLPGPVDYKGDFPEITYMSAFAYAFVMRAPQTRRGFLITAKGAKDFAFVHTHGNAKVSIDRLTTDSANVMIDVSGLSPTNRVDIMVAGRNPGTSWGAPSYISFARMDPKAPYSDPVLTVLPKKKQDSKCPAKAASKR